MLFQNITIELQSRTVSKVLLCSQIGMGPGGQFIGQRSRSQGRYIVFEVTVISHKLSHRKISFFFIDTSLDTLFDEKIKTGASREMTSQKIRQYLTFNM